MLIIGVLCALMISLFPYWHTTVFGWKQKLTAQLVAVSGSQPEIPKRAEAEPVFDAASWLASRGEAPETHGVLIESLDGQHVFASLNAGETFNPASLIKLSTSLVALKQFGADYRFQTRVYADAEVDNSGTLRGSLYVLGNDPTFGDVAANMIARELQQRGIKRVAESVRVSEDFSFNYSESAEESAGRLVKALRVGNPRTEVAGQPAGRLLFTLSSYPLRDILLYMNAHSSNFVAERLGAMVGGPVGIQEFLINEVHLPPDQLKIERASGREHNRMTPRDLLKVIRALVLEAERQGLEPQDIMPVASDDRGTLRRRLTGTGLEGAVVGKTGTLTSEVDGGMASIAGIVYTENAGMVIFVMMDQGNRIGENRQLEDQLLSEVVHSQTSPRAVGSPTPRQLLPSSALKIERQEELKPDSKEAKEERKVAR
ncbi:MAG TPA: D-alanyl-D-alanine carboxypeptidase [Pyrinomonadaceae bacterium]|jgi:D-alanyl-D-alanine carboxypeptidase/D-alanyl-D-alanine-endopeptidase (penicillin-binding protein 4)